MEEWETRVESSERMLVAPRMVVNSWVAADIFSGDISWVIGFESGNGEVDCVVVSLSVMSLIFWCSSFCFILPFI